MHENLSSYKPVSNALKSSHSVPKQGVLNFHKSVVPSNHVRRALGNQALYGLHQNTLIQAELNISQPNDKYEQEADRVADQVMQIPDSGITGISKTNTDTVNDIGTGFFNNARSLSKSEQGFFEPRLGHDLSGVRVHTGSNAVKAAQSINAKAFTLGQNIVFGQGEHNNSKDGQHLMAHELAHTLQQSNHGGVSTIFCQPREETNGLSGLQLPSFNLPGSDLSLIPGPLSPFLGNSQILLPSRLQLRNIPLTGSGPTFMVFLSPQRLMGALLGNIDLYTWTRPGTPSNLPVDPNTQARISLADPVISYNPSLGVLKGNAKLSVGSDYPLIVKAPTELDVSFESTRLGQFSGRIGFGPLISNFELKLHYQTERLEQAVSPVFSPQGGFSGFWARLQSILRQTAPDVRISTFSETLQALWRDLVAGNIVNAQFASRTINLLGQSIPDGADVGALRTALTNLAAEVSRPGFSLSGSLKLFGIPLTGFSAEAPTTMPLDRPLPGAPAPFPLSYRAGGIILAPPGSITDIAVPALGGTISSFGETSGTSATIAALPSISTEAINLGEPLVNQFPVYAYAEVSHVRRISDGLDMGVRVTVQLSTPELFGPNREELNFDEALTRTIQDFQTAQSGTPKLSTPNIGATLFGRFNLF